MIRLTAFAFIPLMAACAAPSGTIPASMQYQCSPDKPAAKGIAGAFAAGRARGEAAAAASGATHCAKADV